MSHLNLAPIRSWEMVLRILEAEDRGISRTRVLELSRRAEFKLIRGIKRDPVLIRIAQDINPRKDSK